MCDVQALFSHYCKVGTVLITGDLNAQLVTDSRLSQNPKSKLLSLFINRNGLVPAHSLFGSNAYTYVPTRSILDYVLVERAASHIITDYSVAKPEEVLTSDHLPVLFQLSFGGERLNIGPRTKPRNINWLKCNDSHLSLYRQEIENEVTRLFKTHNVDDLCPDMLNSALLNILQESEKHLPKTTFNTSAKPYWCPELKHAHAQARYFRSNWLQTGRPRGCDDQSYVEYKSAKSSFRRLQRQCIENHENNVFDQLNKAADTDYRLFWKLLRKHGGSNFEICNTLVVQGSSFYDSDVVNGFYKHFHGVFGSHMPEDELAPNLEQELSQYLSMPSSLHNSFLTDPFEMQELDKVIPSLSRQKSPGHDSLFNEHIIHCGRYVRLLILALFNLVIKHNRVPDDWQTSVITPIDKGKGKDKIDPASNRHISLIPVNSKLFEKAILNRVNNFLHINMVNFPNPQQQGFQSDLSCLTTAFALQETVLYHVERQSDVYVASLDQKAAFDTVRFRALFLKLGRLGFTGKFLRLMIATYTNLKAYVQITGLSSGAIAVSCSVRQGGVLSTFLYLVYVSDLLNDIELSGYGCKVLSVAAGNPAFADDISLLALTPFHLQMMLNIVYSYCQQWNVAINVDKSSVSVFTKNTHTTCRPCRIWQSLSQSNWKLCSSWYFIFVSYEEQR